MTNRQDLLAEARREEEKKLLADLEAKVERLAELDDQIAAYQEARATLWAEGRDLPPKRLEELEALKAEAAPLREQLKASEDTEDSEKSLLGVARFRVARKRVEALADERNPVPTQDEYVRALHALLKCVDHKVATQKDIDERKGESGFFFCECKEHSYEKNEDGSLQRRFYTLALRGGKTLRVSGTYFVPDNQASKAIAEACQKAGQARFRQRKARREAAPEDAQKVLDRVPGRHFVRVQHVFTNDKERSVVRDVLVYDVDEKGTVRLLEAGRLAGFLKAEIGVSIYANERILGRQGYILSQALAAASGPARSAEQASPAEEPRDKGKGGEKRRTSPKHGNLRKPGAEPTPDTGGGPREAIVKAEPLTQCQRAEAKELGVLATPGEHPGFPAITDEEAQGVLARLQAHAASEGETQKEDAADVDATPGARDLASKLNIDIASVVGTGQNGRITKADVEKAARQNA